MLRGAMPNRMFGAIKIKNDKHDQMCETTRSQKMFTSGNLVSKTGRTAIINGESSDVFANNPSEPGAMNRTVPWTGVPIGVLSGVGRSVLAAALTVTVTASALAASETVHCLAPETPMTALPRAVLTEYRAEIVAEFEAYFGAISDFIACLDDERSRAMSEARAATDTYSTFLNTIPARKDIP